MEILQSIANDVDLADIESFAAACKTLDAIAEAKRDLHLQRKTRYSDIIFTCDIPKDRMLRAKSIRSCSSGMSAMTILWVNTLNAFRCLKMMFLNA